MELKRKPFQGVVNIMRFNWHFYAVATVLLMAIIPLKQYLPLNIQPIIYWFQILAITSIGLSLIVSFYIYDLSDLYQFKWLPKLENKNLLNVSAGFDETSEFLNQKLTRGKLTVCDFYHPKKHTEVSIKRARKAYPPFENTVSVGTNNLPFPDHSFDYTLAVLSAHEIRNEKERILFFKELHRTLKPEGEIYVTEHLRDLFNLIAYTFGVFHFHSRPTWKRTFNQSGFKILHEIKTTAFISTFVLVKNGNTT